MAYTPDLRLTLVQHNVLEFIFDFMRANTYAPTVAEITRHFTWASNNAAAAHLLALRRKGYLADTPFGVSRGIVPLRDTEGRPGMFVWIGTPGAAETQ